MITRKTKNSAGADIQSNVSCKIAPNETLKIPTGVFGKDIALPINTYGKLESRSSLAAKGLIVIGGVIDNDYEGEICVLLHNLSKMDITISKGARIAQLIVLPFVGHFPAEDIQRGTGGFGSTGQ